MRKGGGRSKGNSFERKVAAMVVSTFADKGITKEDCYRTPLSGGHRYAKGKDPGDLVISKKLEKYFPFATECKSYKSIYLPALWLPSKSWKKAWKFKQWLKQTCAACTEDRHPLLIFKGNGTPEFAVLPRLMTLTVGLKPRLMIEYEGEEWMVVLFSNLLKRLRKGVK